MAEPPAAHVKRVEGYLREAVSRSRGTDVQPFTIQAIAEETGLTPAEAASAIGAKDSEIEEHLVYVKIHLPMTVAGERVWRRLAKAGLISRSAFAAMFLVLLTGFLLVSTVPRSRISEAQLGEADVYLRGAGDAILFMGTAGLILAAMLHNYGSRHLRWTAVNAGLNEKLWSATKLSAAGGAVCAAFAMAVAWWVGRGIDLGVGATWFAVGFPVGTTYWALFRRQERE